MDQLAFISSRKRKCSNCGNVLDYVALGEYVCSFCGNKELDDYGIIRKFLDEHGPASASVIETSTGVPRAIINQYLKKGRLEITDGSPVFLKCERCGKNIKFGRICAACAKNTVSKMEETVPIEEIGEEPIPLDKLPVRKDRMFTHNK